MTKFSLFGYEIKITKKLDLADELFEIAENYIEGREVFSWKIVLIKALREYKHNVVALREAKNMVEDMFDFSTNPPTKR